jgi:hypothetical protein
MNGTRSERLGEGRSSLQCAGRGGEGQEERVALGVDLDPAFVSAGLADQLSVLAERLRVVLRTKLVEKLRRTLDVGEEESDLAAWEVVSHARRDHPPGGAARLLFLELRG